jgi:hypothetical protein
MQKICLIIIILFKVYVSFGQFGMGNVKEIKEVQKRKLIVVLETVAAKGKDNNSYINDINTYNENIKFIAEKYWPYNKDSIIYKTYDEVEKMKKMKSKNYAVLYCISATPSKLMSGYFHENGILWEDDMDKHVLDKETLTSTNFEINLIEKFGKQAVYSTPLFEVFPNKSSLIFGIQNAISYFDFRVKKKEKEKNINAEEELNLMISQNASMLKSKTLLIREDWSDKEMSDDEIKKHYGYEYKICTKSEFETAIVNNDPGYAYFAVLPMVVSSRDKNFVVFVQYIYNCEDHKLLGFVKPGLGALMGAGYFGKDAGDRTISKKSLKTFRKQIDE